jgi:DNA-binding GntR family transcriptional regulator
VKRKVNPLNSLADIRRIREVLREKPRDLLLFDLATQTGMEINQILNLRVRDLVGCKAGDQLIFPRPGEKAPTRIMISSTLHQSWEKYLRDISPSPDDYLIKSQKKSGPPTLSSVSHMINGWFEAAHVKGVKGAKSLKRTWEAFFKSRSLQSAKREKRIEKKSPNDYMQVLKPIGEISTIQETVHAELFNAIIRGRIPPGEKIVIDKIAMQMRVSRIPVREALHRLQEAGLISIDKWKGAIINKLSIENLKEITRIRLMIESQAAQRAADNCSPQLSRELEILHEQWKQSIPLMEKSDLKTVEEYLGLNRRFHHAIYRGAHMPILQQIINGLWDRVSPYLHILVAGEIEGAVTSETIQIHEAMLNGMKNRSAEEVSRWLREDLIRAEESIVKFFNQ